VSDALRDYPDMNDATLPPEPPPPGDDDAAAARGGEGETPKSKAPRKAPAKRKPSVDTGVLQRLFRDFAYQYGTDIAWDRDRREPIRISNLRHTFGHDAVKLWMTSERRDVVHAEDVVFDPTEACGPHAVNLWTGWGVEPDRGDVEPFLELLEFLVDGDKAVMEYCLNWYALPLQKPGIKLKTALVFHGYEGSGKNLLHEVVASVYGKHGKVVGQRELESQWTDWQSGCQFAIGDEVVSRAEMRHHKGVLKGLITSSHLNIATKFMNLRSERNCMNIVFHSNEVEPLKLDPTDRRYLVVWTPKRGDQALYDRFVKWREEGGAAHLMHWLQHRNLADWAWYEPPPMTAAKEDLIELGRLSPERFWRSWRGNEIVGLPCRSCSVDQAYQAYKRWAMQEGERFPMSKPQFSRLVLREAGSSEFKAVQARVGTGQMAPVMRLWLMATPPPDVSLSDHAKACIDSFEQVLRQWSGPGAVAEQ